MGQALEDITVGSGCRGPLAVRLGVLLIPQTEMPIGNIEPKVEPFAAAPDAAFVGAGSGGMGVAVPQQAGVPLKAQAVAADAGLPQARRGRTVLQAGHLP